MMSLVQNLPVTAIYVGLFGLLSVTLANFVLFVRLRSGPTNPHPRPDWQVDAALRVQANFVENVPLALMMLLVLELQGTSGIVLHVFGATLFLLRLLHALGLGTIKGANYPRLIGAQGTFALMAVMAIACIGSSIL